MGQKIEHPMESSRSDAMESKPTASTASRPDLGTWAAFGALVFLIAGNTVAVRFSNLELPPFWGAGTRFLCASLLFLSYALVKRLRLPRGRALTGVLIYGLLQFGIGFALIYWALQKVPASLGSVILATVPLFTVLLTVLVRLEPFRLRGLAGALAAVVGIAVMFGERVSSAPASGDGIPLPYLLAAVGTAVMIAIAAIVIKKFPQVHLASTNGFGMLTGASILLALSLTSREPVFLPRQPATWAAFLYLVLPGSVGVFGLLLFVLKRWPVTKVSYQTVLSPIVAIALSAWLLDEPLTGGLFLGSIMVIAGVYIGVLAPERGLKPKSS